jgi:glycosyltransferase involved in cell wall biosynthesis
MPLVSVIIPNYNHARFLEKRIQSVLDQTFQDFDLIILDDASTDNSREIIERYRSHPKIVHIEYNETNSGTPFKQWNKGVRLAGGEYIWMAESDDYADERFLEIMVPHLEVDPKVGLVNCQSREVNERGDLRDIIQYSLLGERWTKDYRNDGQQECAQYLSFRCTVQNASSVLFRRDLFLKVGLADESMRQAGDYLMWVKILLNSDISFVAQPLNFYRDHAQNHSKQFYDSPTLWEEYMEVVGFILQSVTISHETRVAVLRNLSDRLACSKLAIDFQTSVRSATGAQILKEVNAILPLSFESMANEHYETAHRCYQFAAKCSRGCLRGRLALVLFWLGQAGATLRAVARTIKRRLPT